ncbi:MAG: hypothetical protein A3K19_33145 [Lentisphaerae bacterium RIFOXYB12_FULL_65_16]|nr:MAG: hypothetical protein A3K18_02285 [Lentisphaerae bacterium RIFOXYA12_64_32]OGV86983.1 MAG: hypothetical protein A3K19_33145 [Lentisphaerae bacterium RIFOXYB12_FULL_65_16]
MAKGKGVILCIDDDPDILSFFKTVLEAEGHKVVVAATGEDGLKAFRERKPDMVFVDLMMEEVDAGASFVRHVKASGSQVPMYMVTSVGDALNSNIDYSSLGVKGVIQKPVNIPNLLQIVNIALKS